VADLVQGHFADASILRHEDCWWIFTCGTPHRHDQLRLFYSTHLEGPWREHPKSPLIDGDASVARPAGRLIRWHDHLIRYAQDCVPKYGSRVHAFRITSLTLQNYQEEPVIENPVLAPDGEHWTDCGAHHLDPHPDGSGGWIACVDGLGYLEA
jgi:hypothetical protein